MDFDLLAATPIRCGKVYETKVGTIFTDLITPDCNENYGLRSTLTMR